jgi:hypothetical protein
MTCVPRTTKTCNALGLGESSMKKSMIGITAGVVAVATGASFGANDATLYQTNTGEQLPLVSTGHIMSATDGTAVLYAPTQDDNATFRGDLSAALGGMTVDYYDSRAGTPTLAELAPYMAVFTWVNYPYSDTVAMGDVLADYVDAGGIVILGQWCVDTGQLNDLEGRIMTDPGYLPITAIQRTSGAYAMDGVMCVHGGVGAYDTQYLDEVNLVAGNISDGTFTPSNTLAVAWRPDAMVYYSPGNTGYDFGTGDWNILTANMILCRPCRADVNGDGVVDVLDLLAVIAAWGNTGGPEDIIPDGIVNVLDLLAVIADWGPCFPMGACCTPDGGCTDMIETDCLIAGGDWYEGEECASFTCPALPTGACCVGVDCVETNLEYFCDQLGGVWYEGEDCATFICTCDYCDVCYTNQGGPGLTCPDPSGAPDDWITNVTFNTINNDTNVEQNPCSYGDYTYLSTDVIVGQTYTLSVSFCSEGVYTEYVTAWIDWNLNCEFDEATERYDLGSGVDATLTLDIIVPADAMIGPTTMRVIEQYNVAPTDACAGATYGETEDYTINVMAP